MARTMRVVAVLMLASAVVQASHCSGGAECLSDIKPDSAASRLETKLEVGVFRDGGKDNHCSSGGECPIDDYPQPFVSLLQTRLGMNVPEVGGEAPTMEAPTVEAATKEAPTTEAAVGTRPKAIVKVVGRAANFSMPGDSSQDQLKVCVQEYADGLDNLEGGLGSYVRQMSLEPASLSKEALVFGAGSGTTGTHSLHAALQMLGMSGWHFNTGSNWTASLFSIMGEGSEFLGVPSGMERSYGAKAISECHAELERYHYTTLPEGIQYVLDTPTSQLFLHLYLSYPHAKFILTTRPLLEWAASRRKHTWALAPVMSPCGQHIEDFPDNGQLAQLEALRQELVRCVVPKERLFEFSVFTTTKEKQRAILPRLASFVGRACPENMTFPALN